MIRLNSIHYSLWKTIIRPKLSTLQNFDFRNGAKKLGHLDHPLQSYGKIFFNIF